MDVRSAVKDKENYAAIVTWFYSLGTMDAEQLVLLADTIGEMSEEIFEHYQALRSLLKSQLQRIRRICEEMPCQEAFPDDSMRAQLSYVVDKACRLGAVLPEKYEGLANALSK